MLVCPGSYPFDVHFLSDATRLARLFDGLSLRVFSVPFLREPSQANLVEAGKPRAPLALPSRSPS